MEDTKFELEGQIEDNDELLNEFEDEEEYYERGPGIYILLVLFIILFLSATSLFVYYQFYLGDGKWDFSMEKRTNSSMVVNIELQEENKVLKEQIESLEISTNTIGSEGDIDEFKDSYESTETDKDMSSELFHPDLEGTRYEVQIGAFQNYDFTKYNQYLVNMNVDVQDGFNKLVIGRFNSFEDACAFRQDLKLLGISGSFIVKKIDGERVEFDRWCP